MLTNTAYFGSNKEANSVDHFWAIGFRQTMLLEVAYEQLYPDPGTLNLLAVARASGVKVEELPGRLKWFVAGMDFETAKSMFKLFLEIEGWQAFMLFVSVP